MFRNIKDFIKYVIDNFPSIAFVLVVLFVMLLIHVLFLVYYFGSTPKITEGRVIEKHFIASSYSEVICPVEGTSLTTNIKRIHIPAKYSIVVKKDSSKETFYVDSHTFYKINVGSYFSTNEKLVISK